MATTDRSSDPRDWPWPAALRGPLRSAACGFESSTPSPTAPSPATPPESCCWTPTPSRTTPGSRAWPPRSTSPRPRSPTRCPRAARPTGRCAGSPRPPRSTCAATPRSPPPMSCAPRAPRPARSGSPRAAACSPPPPHDDGTITLDFPTAPLTRGRRSRTGSPRRSAPRSLSARDTGPHIGDLLVELADEKAVRGLRPRPPGPRATTPSAASSPPPRAEDPAAGYDFVSRVLLPARRHRRGPGDRQRAHRARALLVRPARPRRS